MAAASTESSDVFVVHVARDGEADRTYEVARRESKWVLHEVTRGGSERSHLDSGRDAVRLVAAHVPLHLDALTSLRFGPARWGPSPAELLTALTIGDDALEAPDSEDSFDVDVVGLAEQVKALRCWIGSSHVAALVQRDEVLAVLLDEDEAGLSGDTVAEYAWYSDAGGAPTSWEGGASLIRLTGTLGLDHRWGDVETDNTLTDLPLSGSELTDTVATWIGSLDDADVATAFAHEVFDPAGSLTETERQRWLELMDAVDVRVSIHLDQPHQDDVLRRLSGSSDYAAVRAAFTHPRGAMGKALRGALEQYEEEGGGLSQYLHWPR